MNQQRIYVDRTIAAPQWAVWERIGDVRTWADWGPFDVAELEATGSPVPQGEGAIRRFRTGRRTTREEVIAYDAPRTLAYRLLSGVPVRGYVAAVSLRTTNEGTVVAWSSRFRPVIPGTGGAIREQLRRFIEDLLDGLVRHLEADATDTLPQPTPGGAESRVGAGAVR